MHHLGIDLAWNDRRRTGLAVVDDSGALVDSTRLVSDPDLHAWIGRWPDLGVIGIDAPLIVRNELGSRECEKAIGRAYGRYDAGAYPSNRANPLFDPPRAWRLAEHLGWATDPDAVERPLALEVYPHAGMVGLFRLGRVLPYKARPTRTVADRRAALLQVCALLEEVRVLDLPSSARWAELREAVESASRPFHLGRVEDEIDAILCAHLAWIWDQGTGALIVYGSATDGFIVAPPPPTHEPTPRPSGRLSRSAPGPR